MRGLPEIPGPGFGPRLREARRARKLTQHGLAAAAGLSTASIRSYEHGRRSPTDDSMAALRRALDASPERGSEGRNPDCVRRATAAISGLSAQGALAAARFAEYLLGLETDAFARPRL